MNIHWLWSITALTSELCEIITYLEDDSHYTKADAAEQLKEVLEKHIQPMVDKAMNEVST